MARPKKAADEKRDKRLTVYFTEEEETRLNYVAEYLTTDKAKFVVRAVNNEISRLNDPPEQLAKTKHSKIMDTEKEQVTGYICSFGHAFWMEMSWPSPPLSCPCCGSKEIKRTWAGRAYKGFV